jgi:hypothetical protein
MLASSVNVKAKSFSVEDRVDLLEPTVHPPKAKASEMPTDGWLVELELKRFCN